MFDDDDPADPDAMHVAYSRCPMFDDACWIRAPTRAASLAFVKYSLMYPCASVRREPSFNDACRIRAPPYAVYQATHVALSRCSTYSSLDPCAPMRREPSLIAGCYSAACDAHIGLRYSADYTADWYPAARGICHD